MTPNIDIVGSAILVFVSSLLLSLSMIPLVLRLAQQKGLVDRGNARTIHLRPVARLGGVAIFTAVTCVTLGMCLGLGTNRTMAPDVRTRILVIMVGASGVFMLGLLDDLRALPAKTKLLSELAVALFVCMFDIRIQSITVPGWPPVSLGWLSWPLTVLWIVGITNAVNLIDGLDGLAAGICAISCGAIAFAAFSFGQFALGAVLLSLVGALVGFLCFNFYPARIFMGDSGSLFLGFTIASLAVAFSNKTHVLAGIGLPVIALGIPIFDTLFSMLRRFLQRRSLFAPDKSHFHHRLLERGMNQKRVALTAYGVTLAGAGLGAIMLRHEGLPAVCVWVGALLFIIAIFRLTGAVRFRENLRHYHQRATIQRLIRTETKSFEELQQHFNNSNTFGDWWQAVCLAADKLGLVQLFISSEDRHDLSQSLSWQSTGKSPQVLSFVIPIHPPDQQVPMKLKADVSIEESLEDTGHRIMLFNRLLEENRCA